MGHGGGDQSVAGVSPVAQLPQAPTTGVKLDPPKPFEGNSSDATQVDTWLY